MRIETPTKTGRAWIDLHRPRAARALLVLTHGAGGGVNTPDVTAITTAAVPAGIAVALITQPYRVAGRRHAARAGPAGRGLADRPGGAAQAPRHRRRCR